MKTGRALLATLSALLASQIPAFGQTETEDPSSLINEALTEWRICNDASYIVRSATAFTRGGQLQVEGWTEILSGDCVSVSVPIDSPRFLFAESLPLHQGGIREWKGQTTFCVSRSDFEIDATESCEGRDRTNRGFLAIRPGEPETRLRETGDYSTDAARIALTQRLLRDAGYPVSRIDGLSGRGTSRLIRQFRRDRELDTSVTGAALIAALRTQVDAVNQEVGLEVCNDSSRTVWSALATRQSGNWRSRGWWKTEPDMCSKIFTEPLPGSEAHVYAVQGQDDGPDRRLRSVATGPTQFCISEAQFDALGNELCVEQGYAIASFRSVPTDNDGARMRLTDADFADPSPDGLRR